jgi:hypothetical protein
MRTVGTEIVLIVLVAASPGWSQEASVAPSSMNRSPAARTSADESGRSGRLEDSEEAKERQRRLQKALEGLGSARDAMELKEHLTVLGADFPDARPLLVTASERGSPRVRALAMKLFGDHGNVEDDLQTVVGGLADQAASVRMAAVAALRGLGKEGSEALLRHLPGERDHGIRKMAVRNLKLWDYKDAIPALARLMSSEKHPAVRKQLIRTLESLSGKRYGDDSEAWLAFAEEYLYRKNEKRILDYSRSKSGKAENETKRPR